ncbi:hypothetical protein NDU88_006767 [Pleurodeles waltl]|uniref:Uncharacterized protein n=1 Tax=Pleurodeles waltl TaxID=8319 RepID=A0AAV7VNK1_PLEWA|nr:hypothetical protein NDU88_006767 [Pleurodeles waltl]
MGKQSPGLRKVIGASSWKRDMYLKLYDAKVADGGGWEWLQGSDDASDGKDVRLLKGRYVHYQCMGLDQAAKVQQVKEKDAAAEVNQEWT